MCEVGGSVLLETSKGDVVIDLYTKDCPKTCENFIKLCKAKYYNECAFHRIERDFVAQCGDADRKGGCSIWGLIDPRRGQRFFEDELKPQKRRKNKLRHERRGVVTMANAGAPNTNGSQFMIQLGDRHIEYLDEKHTIFGEVAEGWDVLEKINNAVVDDDSKPLSRFAIQHVHVLEDPFPDPPGLAAILPSRSPSPEIDSDDDYVSSGSEDAHDADEEKISALREAREAKSRELILQITGDIADADLEPPKNVLFVCCLNPVTEDEGLEIAFSRFGKITSCEILRAKDGKSLQYAFIEFATVKSCEQAYLKMEGVRIDDRRIHIDFSQSVPKVWNKWMSGEEKGKDPLPPPPPPGKAEDKSNSRRDAPRDAPAGDRDRERDVPRQDGGRRDRDEGRDRDRDRDRDRRDRDRDADRDRRSYRDYDRREREDRDYDRRRRDDRDRDRDRRERRDRR
eukprot:TRINITY_DN2079_c0_g1_i1.p1 TRINITY_DN2079_c0_g1~~TRINITY_DN2079_c0_g1_i1.p1  ORF type:complete len:454 (+),score=158.38 TRINITY_DN2079_c0_g1_i1:66-1427(+)